MAMLGGPTHKLVLLGDGGVGKTCLQTQLIHQHFVETYDPTLEESNRKQAVIDREPCQIEILDTAGQEDYSTLRDQWIRDGEGFLLVYSILSRSSFSTVRPFHAQIQQVLGKKVPIMIVGNKSDLQSGREVSQQEGAALARELDCSFVETSAKKALNVEKAFYDVVRMLRKMKRKEMDAQEPPRGRGEYLAPSTTGERDRSWKARLGRLFHGRQGGQH